MRNEIIKVKGQSLFEILVAVAVAAIILTGLVSLTVSSVRNASLSKSRSVSTEFSREATEWLRQERDKDWTLFAGYATTAGNTYCLSTLSWTDNSECDDTTPPTYIPGTNVVRWVVLTSDNNNPALATRVEAEVGLFWEDAQGVHIITDVAIFTDWLASGFITPTPGPPTAIPTPTTNPPTATPTPDSSSEIPTNTPTPTPVTAGCTDTDGGLNYTVAGTVNGYNNCTRNDICDIYSPQLLERYCGSDDRCLTQYVYCDEVVGPGYSCNSGRCINSSSDI